MTVVLRMPRAVASEAKQKWRSARTDVARAAFSPRSVLTLSEWADRYRMLSADLGEPGQWKTDRVPYMRRIMDAITDPRVRDVSVVKPTRIGATQALVCNSVGYYVDQEPSPIIVALPTIDDATKFSTQLLQPMLDDTPCLADRVESVRSKKKRSTMLQKVFPGGTLQIVGTKSPRAMRMVHGRIILMSEIDAYEFSAGKEGDPTKLLVKRAGSYGAPKFVRESTPLIKETSRIQPAYESGSMETFQVPCPHCGEYQELLWGGRDVLYGIKWEPNQPETAHYVCRPNGCVIEESEKFGMTARGRWVAEHPERTSHLSFRLNSLVSPFDGARWSLLVGEWYDAQGKPDQLKVFFNTVLGLVWEEEGEEVDAHVLADRVSEYPRHPDAGENEGPDAYLVPGGVGVLVETVDVQGDRLERDVWGFGAGEEMWYVDHDMIPGDPGTAEPWAALDAARARFYIHEFGASIRPEVCFVDSGGHHASAVYDYCKARQSQRVYAIKGSSLEGAPLLGKPTRNNAAKAILFMVGSFSAKEAFLARLAKVKEPGPGYVHLPPWIDGGQMSQLVAEKLVTRFVGGRPKRVFVKTGRNERLDLAAYALCALRALGSAKIKNLKKLAADLKSRGEAARAETAEQAGLGANVGERPEAESKPRARPRGTWMRGFRGR